MSRDDDDDEINDCNKYFFWFFQTESNISKDL